MPLPLQQLLLGVALPASVAGIVLLATRYTMYESSGRLYQAGLKGLGPCGEFGTA